jgi:hypothetical protein
MSFPATSAAASSSAALLQRGAVVRSNIVGQDYTGTDMNQVVNNDIGTSFDGGLARPNAVGVKIDNGASNNQIGGTLATERNLIHGNASYGIHVTDTSTSNLVRSELARLQMRPALKLTAARRSDLWLLLRSRRE